MKRPFAFIGFSYLLGSLVAFFIGELNPLFVLFTSLAVLLVSIIRTGKNINLILSAVGLTVSITLIIVVNLFNSANYMQYENKQYELKGEVVEFLGENNGNSSYKVKVKKLDNIDKSFNIILYSTKNLLFTPYDIIECSVTLKPFNDKSGFSSKKNKLADGIPMLGKLVTAVPTKIIYVSNKPPEYIFHAMRSQLQETIDMLFSEDTADILSAMILGAGNRISNEVYTDFKLSGVNHILVISGMHMAIIAGLALFLLKKIRLHRKAVLIIAIFIVVFYMGMTGFGKSVVRSGLMYIILLISFFIGEEADSLNSLGFAVFLICLTNPYSAADVGFLLSVSATAGIIAVSEKIKYNGNRIIATILAPLAVSISAFIFILPVLLYVYGTINPLSIITGTILAVPSSLLLSLGVITVLIGSVSFLLPLCAPLAIAVTLLTKFTLFVTSSFAEIGYHIPYLKNEIAVILFIGILLLTAIFILRKPSKKVVCVYLSTLIVMFSTALVSPQLNNSVRLVTEDMGYGLFVFLIKDKQAAVLSADGYNTSDVDYYLRRMGCEKITYLVTDGSNSATNLMTEKLAMSVNTETILAPKDTPLGAINRENSDKIQRYQRDYSFKPFDDNSVNVDVEFYGKLFIINIYDKTVIIEKEKMDSVKFECDLAITLSEETKINSSFTILRADDIINVKFDGNYILLPKEKYSVDFNENKPIKIRRLN